VAAKKWGIAMNDVVGEKRNLAERVVVWDLLI
jgi:hypothetical protein